MIKLRFYFIFILFSCISVVYGQELSGLNIFYAFDNDHRLTDEEKKVLINNAFEDVRNIILIDSDIQHYDWDKQIITLNESGREKMRKLDPSVHGFMAVLVLNDKPVYNFIIQYWASSNQYDNTISAGWDNSRPYLWLNFGWGRKNCNR